jgi:phosphoribosyl-dephospho-CoA transferase
MSTWTFTRHDLAWLKPDASRIPFTGTTPGLQLYPEDGAVLSRWIRLERPAVVSRQSARPHGGVALGIALPKSQGLRRIAFQAPMSALREIRRPLALREVIVTARGAWQAGLAALDQALAGFCPRVYGSVAWQCLTGETYLTAKSDIDLLVAPGNLGELEATLQALTAFQSSTALKLDGEVLLPGGGAVAWRELARRPRTVLVKSLRVVELTPIERVLAQFDAEVAA